MDDADKRTACVEKVATNPLVGQDFGLNLRNADIDSLPINLSYYKLFKK